MNLDPVSIIARIREEEAPPGWTLTAAIVLLMLYFIARVVMLAIVSMVLDSSAVAQGVISAMVTNVAGAATGVVVLVLIAGMLRRQISGPLMPALRLGRWPGSVLVLVIVSLGMAILVDFLPLLVQRISLPVALQGMVGASLPVWLAAVVNLVIIGPLAEVTLVMGVLYPALAARMDNLRAVLLAALAYAVIQVFDTPSDLLLWATAFLAGLYFAGLRGHQKSTRAAVIAAAMFGVFAVFKALRLFL
ncbi:MAG: hypothetical protein Kow0077_08690 [Anaerolineae bacterium]